MITSATPDQVAEWSEKLRESAQSGTVVAIGGPKTEGVEVEGVMVCNTIDDLMSAVNPASGS